MKTKTKVSIRASAGEYSPLSLPFSLFPSVLVFLFAGFILFTLCSPLISSSVRFLCFFPCFLLLFSLPFFLATHWLFIEAEPTGCSPVRLFFPWQRTSPAGTWIWDSILISPGVYLHVGILFKPRVLARLGHQQSRSCWTVSGGFFPVSKTC
ncbi:hypothetical protein NC653_037258 [Populus alba x Populus x berolinensis]|uniref:Uncharacterized protein n=1 Tax=Populus alba x Populus x berolinensis TaxID=444605 RepID=A0AAD6LEH5_9ROSI|nr:hypothetical protein NC653_037258 [Populus alba x Populus x berolinensis]